MKQHERWLDHENNEYIHIIRPNISLKKGLFKMLIGISTFIVSMSFCMFYFTQIYILNWFLIISSTYLIILALFKKIKPMLIWCILAYQKIFPMEIRLSCLFEPCCSDYMMLSIEKYGVLRGVFKGIKRIFRCRPPYGGIDYP